MFVLSIIVSFKIQFNNYNIKSMFSSIRGEKTSLFMSLGIKIGVGSIVATASSIIIGGYSSVIWMMLFSLITSSLIYYEAYLGKKYRQKYGECSETNSIENIWETKNSKISISSTSYIRYQKIEE